MTPRAAMEGWLRRWAGPEAVNASMNVELNEPAAKVRVARALTDCIVRQLLPLQHPDSPRAGAIATLATLAPIVDAPSLRAAMTLLARVRETSGGTLSLGSAAVALGHIDRMTDARSPEVVDEAWASLFYAAGPLHMAVARAARAGVSPETIRDALIEAMRRLAA